MNMIKERKLTNDEDKIQHDREKETGDHYEEILTGDIEEFKLG